MFVAMSLIPLGDAAGKVLTTSLSASPLFVAASRFLLGALVVLPFLPRGGLRVFTDFRIWIRGAFLAGGILSIQTALQTAPLADVFAAFFIAPAFSTVLAIVFLKEKITGLQGLLIGLGFVGVLLVVRPGFDMAEGMEYAVLAGMFYGAYLTASRWLGAAAAPQTLLFSQLTIGALITLPLSLSHWPELSLSVTGLTLISALASMAGNGLLILAYQQKSASELAPLVYFQLVAATLLGALVFGNLPDFATWAGLALILVAGISAARLNARPPLSTRADRR